MKGESTFFAVIDCGKRSIVLLTRSAKKAASMLETGKRIEVWCGKVFVEKVYTKNKKNIRKYVERERAYIAEKQARAEHRNNKRRERAILRAV